jgi:hypothetical protein
MIEFSCQQVANISVLLEQCDVEEQAHEQLLNRINVLLATIDLCRRRRSIEEIGLWHMVRLEGVRARRRRLERLIRAEASDD